MNKKQLKEYTGSFSKPSKMPGYSYGLPAWECQTGGKLSKIKGTVCYDCYAKKGFYAMYKTVKEAQYKRFKAIDRPKWVHMMASQIRLFKTKEFRWHDAGDIKSVKHLLKIFKVCKLTPGVNLHTLKIFSKCLTLLISPATCQRNSLVLKRLICEAII